MPKTIPSLLLLLALLLPRGPVHADEAAVRQAGEALVAAWNRHDVPAWSAFLADDVWYSETWDSYERFKGKEKAVATMSFAVENGDLQWEIRRMKTRPDGVVSVALVQRVSMLPKTDGRYQAVFVSDPSLARWRRDPDGRWRLVFFTSDKGWARAEIRKDDEAGSVAAVAPAPAPRAAAPRGGSGREPAEYTAFWGPRAQGCNYCHGRPPMLPSSEQASRIVAAGAAAADGAGLRATMGRAELGGVMDHVLADPALDAAALETLRRYLVDVRDGALPAELAFDAAGASRAVELRNERSTRDAPATIAALSVSGPFVLDAERSGCAPGRPLAGQAGCSLVLRARPDATPGATGLLELRFAPTPGLTPQARRMVLRVGD